MQLPSREPSAPLPAGPRSDLACESDSPAARSSVEEHTVGIARITLTRREEEDGGHSVTLAVGPLSEHGEDELTALASLLAHELTAMAERLLGHPVTPRLRVLVVGLGNVDMTPDALGPGTVRRLTATRHLRAWDEALYDALGCCELSTLAPGVMGQTGLESAELVQAALTPAAPDLLVVVDALAARSCARLSSTIQLSDRGIAPGAGIGNHRMAIDERTMGIPVLAIGVPTVVDSATLVLDALEKAGLDPATLPASLADVLHTGRSFIVAPRDADRLIERTTRVLAESIDRAFGIERGTP